MSLKELLPKQWRDLLGTKSDLLNSIALSEDTIPNISNIFRAFEIPIAQIKVVIIGQDPYPNPEHAMGLSFSVPREVSKLPPTLRNIFKELETDLGITNESGDLSPWHEQGVFLLNRVLTTKSGISQGHKDLGWQEFTNEVIKVLADKKIVFILWGESAGELAKYIDPAKTIRSPHPSPLSSYRGFFGSKPFSKANELLINFGFSEIDWRT